MMPLRRVINMYSDVMRHTGVRSHKVHLQESQQIGKFNCLKFVPFTSSRKHSIKYLTKMTVDEDDHGLMRATRRRW